MRKPAKEFPLFDWNSVFASKAMLCRIPNSTGLEQFSRWILYLRFPHALLNGFAGLIVAHFSGERSFFSVVVRFARKPI